MARKRSNRDVARSGCAGGLHGRKTPAKGSRPEGSPPDEGNSRNNRNKTLNSMEVGPSVL